MIVLIVVALILSLPMPPDLLEKASHYGSQLQLSCLSFLPAHTEYREALGALVCGQSLPSSDLKESLLRLSLIHLFVVSGSHLIWIEQVLQLLKIPTVIRTAFLFFYAVLTGWQAPAVRALVHIGLRLVFSRLHIYLPSDLRTLVSGFATLGFFPKWWNSLSLLMSWSASLALSVNFLFSNFTQSWKRILATQTLIWMLMLGPLWGLGHLHPLSCLYNLILGPFVGLGLLPFALLTLIFPKYLLPLFEGLMEILILTEKYFTEPIQHAEATKISVEILWMWIALWHIAFHFLRIFYRRKREVSL